jgi:tetratricopeptide (TPR) repeat protein
MKTLALASLTLVAHSTAFAADRPWTEVRTPNFIVATDSDERTARRLGWEVEQVRAGLRILSPWARLETGSPIIVLSPRNQSSMEDLVPALAERRSQYRPAAVTAATPDRSYLVLQADRLADNARLSPYVRGYAPFALQAISAGAAHPIPLWAANGLAWVAANILVRDAEIELGRPITQYIDTLRRGERLRLQEMFAVDRSSPYAENDEASRWWAESARRNVFDAQSWMFVHFLLFSDAGKQRPAFNAFMTAVLNGTPAADAAESAFGDLGPLEEAFVLYLRRSNFEHIRLKADPAIKPQEFQARPWSPAESAAMRAGLLVASRRPKEARTLLAQAKEADPKHPRAYEVEGVLLDLERDFPGAATAYGRAVELESDHFYPSYRLGLLASQTATPESLALASKHLEHALVLNNRFAPTLTTLGTIRMRQGQRSDALAMLADAVDLDPRSAQAQLSFALALEAGGRVADAVAHAERAVALAQTDAQRGPAQQLLNRLRAAQPAPAR